MAHPTTRVLAVLELLQAHGRLTGPEMAQRLGVNVRTLRRYLAYLTTRGFAPMIANTIDVVFGNPYTACGLSKHEHK